MAPDQKWLDQKTVANDFDNQFGTVKKCWSFLWKKGHNLLSMLSKGCAVFSTKKGTALYKQECNKRSIFLENGTIH